MIHVARPLAAAAVALSLAGLSACGSSATRPTSAELAQALGSVGGADPQVTSCTAKVYVDSGLSDGFLRAIVDKDNGYKASEADQKTFATVTGKVMDECAGMAKLKDQIAKLRETPSDTATP